MLTSTPERVYVVVTVPEAAVDSVLEAIAAAGGGQIGLYTHCAFTSRGVGRFKPGSTASPYVGVKGEINTVNEWRVETQCDRSQARAVVTAIRDAHPYEEPVIYVMPMLDPDAL